MKRQKENSLQYDLRGMQSLNQIQNTNTQQQYRKEATKFASFCKEELGINKFFKLENYGFQKAIQAYEKHLESQGLSPATIHTRIAAPCVILGVSMNAIEKPKRRSIDITRSRSGRNPRSAVEEQDDRYSRLVSFQREVGIRRDELAKLTGKDFRKDESGYDCVYVRKGKGGKEQLQRINPDKVDFIRSYFDGSDRRVFSKEEMSNHIDLHAMRAENAKRQYQNYLEKCQDPNYRKKLKRECLLRYKAFNPKREDENDRKYTARSERFIQSLRGMYTLRGSNRILAENKGYPTRFDRLCLMAVSIFYLSHWRLDVTVAHYMLT